MAIEHTLSIIKPDAVPGNPLAKSTAVLKSGLKGFGNGKMLHLDNERRAVSTLSTKSVRFTMI